jgi:2-amino-4-hydroxy-6-hydroxymethyldihydropteridine diphosphokinase
MTFLGSRIVYLGLGSNLGNKLANLEEARHRLQEAGMSILGVSPVYKTEPVDFHDQDWFFNQAVSLRTILEPEQLLRICKGIEKAMGREPTFPKGPRLIDLDILLYMDRVIHEAALIIPHPSMAERRFVLVPLADIAADLIHPQLRVTIRQLLSQCQDKARVFPLLESGQQITYNSGKIKG